MKPQTLELPFTALFETEIGAIAGFYNLPENAILQAVEPIAASFETYWEMVFSETGFELITAGTGPEFAAQVKQVATLQGLSEETIALFGNCHLAFPEAICGLKVCFAAGKKPQPTLYVRTKAPKGDVLTFLGENHSVLTLKLLQQALTENQTLYGLGFSEKQQDLYLKTYTINPVLTEDGAETEGFVSHRLWKGVVDQEHKTYLPEVSLYDFAPESPGLQKLQHFLTHEMNYATAGHIGMLYQNGQLTETKIYVERIGGIPTDFSAK